MISVDEAFHLIQSLKVDFGVELVPLHEALGRVLAEDILADRDFPPFNRVAMDGIAIRHSEFTAGNKAFPIKGTQPAGQGQLTLSDPSKCIEVMTGAVLPQGVDTVIRYEDVLIKDGIANLMISDILQGQNVHHKGKDRLAGDVLLIKNQIIKAAELALLATVGKSLVQVYKLPKVAIVSTGDELVEVEDSPTPFQIRRSNTYAIQGILHSYAILADDYHLKDDKYEVTDVLSNLLDAYDVIVLSGGVSMGKYDYVPQALQDNGVRNIFYKVQQRPGKPFWFGQRQFKEHTTTVFALPGNPISTTMCTQVYLTYWLDHCFSKKQQVIAVQLLEDIHFKPNLTYYLEGKVVIKNGKMGFLPQKGNGSGDLANLSKVDGFVQLPAGKELYEKGELYNFFPLN